MADILIVDDDQAIATAFEHFLTYEGHTFRLASSAAEGMTLLEQRLPDVVMMDVRMPGVDGVTALQQMRRRFPDLYVVMMTAYSSSQSSIDAIRAGAFDYLTKPLDLDQLRGVIGRALAAQHASGESSSAATAGLEPPVMLIGDTPAMREVYKMIGRLATNSVTALIVGEHGTGKGLVVATIHGNSARRDRPLVRSRAPASRKPSWTRPSSVRAPARSNLPRSISCPLPCSRNWRMHWRRNGHRPAVHGYRPRDCHDRSRSGG